MAKKTDEPCIYRTKTGRYQIRVTITHPATGDRVDKQKTLKKGATMTEAIEQRDSLRGAMRARAAEEVPEKDQPITTVASYAIRWVERKGRRLKPSTMAKYRRTLAEYVLPEMGHLRLDHITRRDVSDWIAWAEGQRRDDGRLYARATVASWWRTLKGMLKDAHAEGYIMRDITMRLSPPDTGVGGRQEKRTLTAAQLGTFVEAVRDVSPQWYAEVVTLAYTGMRVGELYGLEWRDIDLEAASLQINRAVWRGEVRSTKTDSPREVPLPKIVADALGEHWTRQMKEQPPGFDEGIVFPSTRGGRRYSSSLLNAMDEVREHLGMEIKVTPQVLRRTFNTLLMEARVDRIVQRSIMGHSSEQMTERYAGVRMDLKRSAVERIFGGGVESE